MSNKPEFIKLMSPKFRVSFPQVFKATAMEEGHAKKFSVVMLFDKEAQKSPEFKAMKAAALKKMEEKFGTDKKKWPANYRNPFRNGGEKSGKYDGYDDDTVFVTASSLEKNRPGLVDQRRQDIISEEDFYAGCYARATVNPYAYSKAGNNGVAFGLLNVQKLADGEAFSAKTKAQDDFDEVEVEDDFGSESEETATEDAGEW